MLDLLTPSKSPSLTRSYALCLVLSVATSLAHADIGEVKCNYSGYFAGPEGGQTAFDAATAVGGLTIYSNSPTYQYACSNGGSTHAYVVWASREITGTSPNQTITDDFKTFHYDFLPANLQRLPDDTTGKGDHCAGNPINPLSGNKYQTETDYYGSGVLPLEFVRTYNSTTNNWQFSYGSGYANEQLVLDDGARKATKHIAATQYVYTSGSCGNSCSSGFTPNTAAVFMLDDNNYYAAASGTLVRFTNPDGIIDTFDMANGGRLIRRENPTGQFLTFTYTSGRLTRVTHFSSRQINLTYDTSGRLATMKDPSNRVTSYTWDTQNRLTRVTYPDATTATTDNPFRTYHYENTTFPLKLTGITDETGQRYATYGYDAEGRANLTEHAGGADRHTFNYNLSPSDGIQTNDTVTVTNPLGRDTTYHLHLDGRRTRVTQLDGAATSLCGAITSSMEYDYNNFVSRRTDNEGNVTTYAHNARGLEESRTEAFGTADARTITTQWHPTRTLPTQIVSPGQTEDRTYDTAGRMLTRTLTDTQTQTIPYSTNGNTRTWTYTYNPTFGLVASIDGPRTDVADVTTFTYDLKGDLLTTTNPLGHVTTVVARDTRGLPTQVRDANNVITVLTWDARSRLTQQNIQHATGNAITKYAYDAVGQLTRVTLPNNSFLNYHYDAAQRLVAVSNNTSERVDYALNAAGDRTAEAIRNPSATITRTMTRVFDELSRLRQHLGANSQDMGYTWDDNNNLVGMDDALGRQTVQDYDALDRLIRITDPAVQDTALDYDARDNLIAVTDPIGVTTSYVHDGLDNLIQESSPDIGTTTHVYDTAGNRIQSTDARGVVVQYTYDALNRQLTTTYPGSTSENAVFTYDAGTNGKGQLTGMTDPSGTTTWTYDHRGNVLSESRTIASTTLTASYTWNTTDLLTRITYPSGRVATVTFDTLGRTTRITTNLPGITAQNVVSAVTYAPFGGTTGWLGGNALTHTRLLDQDYRLTDLTVSSTTATLHDVNYGYNTVDQLTSYVDTLRPAHTQLFGYDVLDRLETASGIYGSQSYSLDANGNRLQRTGTSAQTLTYAPATNRLDTRNGLLLNHDAVGNRLNDNGNRTFTYNHANRRSSVSVSGLLKGTYTYSALGQRTRKVVPVSGGNRTTLFMFGLGGELLSELAVNPDGSRTFTDYYWLNSLPVARHVRVLNTAGAQVSDTRTYLHPDHLGTPRLITNTSRQVIWRLDTDPFGDGVVSEDPDGNSVLEVMPLRFPGQYFDTEAGLAYNYFRDYDQGTGRYTQADPIGLRGGGNRFAYGFGSPISLFDQFGLEPGNGYDKYGPLINTPVIFYQNYVDMRDANTIGADKYFHCKANCQGARQGPVGNVLSGAISETRELSDQYLKDDTPQSCDEDRSANYQGRSEGAESRETTCESACSEYRPPTLPGRY